MNNETYTNKNNRIFIFFAASVLIFTSFSIIFGDGISDLYTLAVKTFFPLILCFFIFSIKGFIKRELLVYVLFFSISIFSFLGLANNINGSHAASPNPYIYGLAFFTAFLAYRLSLKDLEIKDIFMSSNPLILISGPIPVYWESIQKSSYLRIKEYFPFVIVGFFFFKVISSPMTYYLNLIDYRSPLIVFIFAVLFRIFLYFNFAGISLIIYGFFGMMGFKIPLNFTQPFSSRSVVEFWRSWHVTLSIILKELFHNKAKKNINNSSVAITIVFFCSAMWHGVSLNFVMWGLFHSIVFILTVRLLKNNFRILPIFLLVIGIPFGDIMFTDTNTVRLLEKLSNFGEILSVSTLDLSELLMYFSSVPKYVLLSTFIAFILIGMEFFLKDHHLFINKNYEFLRTPTSQFIIIILILLLTSSEGWDYAAYGQR